MEQDKIIVKNKEILVMGLGKTGMGVMKTLVELGAHVSVQENKPMEQMKEDVMAWINDHKVVPYFQSLPQGKSFDMVILSPGVLPTLDFIRQAEAEGAEVMGEVELAYRLAGGNFIAITGTNGKTTTTTLVGEMFQRSGRKTKVVGNIGVAMTPEVIHTRQEDWLVSEISSFQLEKVKTFAPKIAAILNLTPDHLDRHGTMQKYGQAKAEIYKNQGEEDYVVVNFDDKKALALVTSAKSTIVPFSTKERLKFGSFLKKGVLTIRDKEGKEHALCREEELQILGKHNVENALAASAIAFFSGIDAETVRQSLLAFQGVAHRIERCGVVHGVEYINDSKGTNVNASIKAIEAIKGPIIFIGGGYDKQGEFDELINVFPGKVKKALLIGQTAAKIKETAERHHFTETILLANMEDCIAEAARIGKPGDTVLLSPACASWGMYKNYEERGNHFKECVARLKEQ